MDQATGGSPRLPPLFESRVEGRVAYRLFAGSVLLGFCCIWFYRVTHIPEQSGRWAWIGLFVAELWWGFYWLISQSLRWSPLFYSTFKERLSQRFESKLPNVDIFVCTSNATIEPPMLVANTVLSLMAIDYPHEKINVYLSDDGASKFTFHAMVEVANFAKQWLPFCRKLKVEPRSPAMFFSSMSTTLETNEDVISVKKLYVELERSIQTMVSLGTIPNGAIDNHKGYSVLNSVVESNNHEAIVQVIIDPRDTTKSIDIEGFPLPSLVYLAREKRTNCHHNFKAGAMNALIRVSSALSNSPIILNVDCDMYLNNSKALRDAVCFFLDEEKGHDVGYVQFPQNFHNLTKNNLHGDWVSVANVVESHGMNAFGGPPYMGTGCFHRRESICGMKYESFRSTMEKDGLRNSIEIVSMLEATAEKLATCIYEDNTQWGKEMGLKYGYPVEDVITGLSIQCRGWKSIYFNPERKGFLGIAPITLSQMLLQYKRWCEGMFQIFISKYCPIIYGYNKISLPLQMQYSSYLLWAPCSLFTWYYAVVPSLYFVMGIQVFPEISSSWIVPFCYVFIAMHAQNFAEALGTGQTIKGWWNIERSWLMTRLVSFLLGLVDAILAQFGLTNTTFNLTAKVADEESLKRYQNEVMDFGPSSFIFVLLGTFSILQLLCLCCGVAVARMDGGIELVECLFLQFLLCGMLVLISMPIYHGMFFRIDGGKMPTVVTVKSVAFAVLAFAVSQSRFMS